MVDRISTPLNQEATSARLVGILWGSNYIRAVDRWGGRTSLLDASVYP